ncbi:MAG: zinc ribbon domain-containing protein [Nitrospira sp.]|nr:zinc ribbon domain-containing protein [Nitrospira sp.]
MALYEYQCENCNSRFDEIRNLSQRDEPFKCKKCGGSCKRILFPSSPAFPKGLHPEGDSQSPGGPTAIRIDGPATGWRIENNVFMGLACGVDADQRAQISLKGNKFIDVDVPVKRRKKR